METDFRSATQFAVDTAKALGLDPSDVLGMDIHLSPMNLPTVDVTVVAREGSDLSRVVRKYVLNPTLVEESDPVAIT